MVEPAIVVRWTWVDAANAKLVRDTIANAFGRSPDAQVCAAIARRVNDIIRGGLSSMQRRPDLYPSAHVMDEAAIRGTMLVAIDHGYRDRSDPNDAFNRRRAFDEEMARLRSGVLDYDANDGNDTSPTQSWGFTVRCSR